MTRKALNLDKPLLWSWKSFTLDEIRDLIATLERLEMDMARVQEELNAKILRTTTSVARLWLYGRYQNNSFTYDSVHQTLDGLRDYVDFMTRHEERHEKKNVG